MDLKDKIEQRRKERGAEATQVHRKEQKVSEDKLQEKWEVLQTFNNASDEQKQRLLSDSLDIINQAHSATSSVNPNISRQHAEFFVEAAASQAANTWNRALLLGGLAISIYLGFANSWLLALLVICAVLILLGLSNMMFTKIKKTGMIEKHRLQLAATNRLQNEEVGSGESEN